MKLYEYVTLRFVSYLGNIAIIIVIYDIFCTVTNIDNYFKFFPYLSEDFLGICYFFFYWMIVVLHFLFLVELIIRRKNNDFLYKIKEYNYVQFTLFYIGYVFALVNIIGAGSIMFPMIIDLFLHISLLFG